MKLIPTTPGSYVLVLQAHQAARLQVGVLGSLEVQPGWYLYVGSAFGPGGLRARVGRHLAGKGPLRWHIDYLRQVAVPQAVWLVEGQPCEHVWAQALAGSPDCSMPLARFGASDCRCPAHLFYRAERPAVGWFEELLSLHGGCGGAIRALGALDEQAGL